MFRASGKFDHPRLRAFDLATGAIKLAVVVDYVKVHGHPPLSNADFNEHYDRWLRENGKFIEAGVKKAMRGVPTTLASLGGKLGGVGGRLVLALWRARKK